MQHDRLSLEVVVVARRRVRVSLMVEELVASHLWLVEEEVSRTIPTSHYRS